ncbi:glycoside hydrolase family 18 [Bacteroides congonensis]|jgi:hypothetical protein|uniref:glycoside hydrolase family 18 n=1 Tax=Bacteroides TaxID=816 RepID=UPI00033FC105|nr:MULTISPECIES: glycoside hydrolase family 18 [Bacteroides]CDA85126.1 uncharacterized protein BN772_03453 [Bacteroides sp. CAG:754]
MKMKNIKTIGFSFAVALFAASCTDVESINNVDLNGTVKTDEYYAALREWKQTPGLPQVFVWFDSWTGITPTGETSLRGLPDSVTIASNWGGHPKFELTPERRADMEYVQKVKGTKVVVTLFSQNIGDDLPDKEIYHTAGTSRDPEVVRPAIKAYAEDLYRACLECGYDGYDWDYEPGGGMGAGQLWANKVQRTIFVEELSYWFGHGAMDPERDRGDRPMPEKRLLFLIDGEIGVRTGMDKEWLSYYVDYFVLQAYGGMSDWRIEGVFRDMDDWIQQGIITPEEIVRRTITTENFESYASTGGGFLSTMANYIYKGTYNVKGETVNIDQQIGGCGLYRCGFDYNQGKGDYDGSPEYYFLRQGITTLYSIYYDRLNGTSNGDE